jgi:alginate O-acetyltransferase complex protein AlgI
MGRKAPTVTAFLVLVFWPMMLTMLLSGLWHGAGFTYILWGGMHGALLVINHAWREWRPKTWDRATYDRVMIPVGFFLTFFLVTFTMVTFRAGSIVEAVGVYRGMLGVNGASMPVAVLNNLGAAKNVLLFFGVTPDISSGNYFVFSSLWICGLLFIALCGPNSMEIMRRFEPALYFDANVDHGHQLRFLASRRSTFTFTLSNRWAFCIALIFLFGVLGLNRPSEFLYWQF